MSCRYISRGYPRLCCCSIQGLWLVKREFCVQQNSPFKCIAKNQLDKWVPRPPQPAACWRTPAWGETTSAIPPLCPAAPAAAEEPTTAAPTPLTTTATATATVAPAVQAQLQENAGNHPTSASPVLLAVILATSVTRLGHYSKMFKSLFMSYTHYETNLL